MPHYPAIHQCQHCTLWDRRKIPPIQSLSSLTSSSSKGSKIFLHNQCYKKYCDEHSEQQQCPLQLVSSNPQYIPTRTNRSISKVGHSSIFIYESAYCSLGCPKENKDLERKHESLYELVCLRQHFRPFIHDKVKISSQTVAGLARVGLVYSGKFSVWWRESTWTHVLPCWSGLDL